MKKLYTLVQNTNMEKTMTCTTVQHTTVKGKKSWYLKVTANGNDMYINIREGTYQKLVDHETTLYQTKLEFNGNDKVAKPQLKRRR